MFDLERTLSEGEAKQMNPVVLAFVGDAVYSLFVRKWLCLTTDYKTGDLQKLTSSIVSAHAQSGALETLLPILTEEETEIFHRGRNAKKGTKSKNASVSEYNRSTGFEAVIGYLSLTGQKERLQEIFNLLFPEVPKLKKIN